MDMNMARNEPRRYGRAIWWWILGMAVWGIVCTGIWAGWWWHDLHILLLKGHYILSSWGLFILNLFINPGWLILAAGFSLREIWQQRRRRQTV